MNSDLGDNISKFISDLLADQDSGVIGGYCEDGFPLFYANEKMAHMLGYDNVDELAAGIEGMVANTIQELRDKLADRDRDLQTANFQLSQQAQSAALIGALRPFPQPAFLTCSPYQSVANNVCGCV